MNLNIKVNGRIVSKYQHEGQTFIEGRKGSPYSIVLNNPRSTRMKAVVSVDGINVITGEPSSLNDKGYIINPYQTIEIEGWRTSEYSIRSFLFADHKASYGEKSGNGSTNNGVIGVALFEEQISYPSYNMNNVMSPHNSFSALRMMQPMVSYSVGSSALSLSSNSAALGTGQGEAIQSTSHSVEFRSKEAPFDVAAIFYDSYNNLVNRGVVPIKTTVKQPPNPFPNSNGFCKSF